MHVGHSVNTLRLELVLPLRCYIKPRILPGNVCADTRSTCKQSWMTCLPNHRCHHCVLLRYCWCFLHFDHGKKTFHCIWCVNIGRIYWCNTWTRDSSTNMPVNDFVHATTAFRKEVKGKTGWTWGWSHCEASVGGYCFHGCHDQQHTPLPVE